VLDEVCATYIHCRFDGRALFDDPFTSDDVSKRDYFHPSLQGEAPRAGDVGGDVRLHGRDRAALVGHRGQAEGGVSVSLAATDDVGVAAIEYRLNLAPGRDTLPRSSSGRGRQTIASALWT
jgi:hypothetical protein